MALYIPHSIFHLARLLYVRPETFGPYYVNINLQPISMIRTTSNASLVIALKGKGRFQVARLLLDYVSQKVTLPKPVYFANIN